MKIRTCLLALLILCLLSIPAFAEPIAVEANTFSGGKHVEGEALDLRLELRLPLLRDERAEAINDEYNELLSYYINSYATMLYNEQRETWADPDIPLDLTVDFTIHFNDGQIISILLCEGLVLDDQLTEIYTAATYSLSDGRLLTLSDLIQTEEPAIAVAAREVASQIDAARKSDNVWGYYDDVDENIISMYLSDTSFYLRADGAIILFLNPIGISESSSGLCEFELKLD